MPATQASRYDRFLAIAPHPIGADQFARYYLRCEYEDPASEMSFCSYFIVPRGRGARTHFEGNFRRSAGAVTLLAVALAPAPILAIFAIPHDSGIRDPAARAANEADVLREMNAFLGSLAN
jgi:hypothetical protein